MNDDYLDYLRNCAEEEAYHDAEDYEQHCEEEKEAYEDTLSPEQLAKFRQKQKQKQMDDAFKASVMNETNEL